MYRPCDDEKISYNTRSKKIKTPYICVEKVCKYTYPYYMEKKSKENENQHNENNLK